MATAEFGKAVRRWRDQVSPETAGLTVGGQRRAPGLRREELALLAGISVDYVTRLEQGRAANPSTQVVESLARALRLSAAERAHLFLLAGLALPDPETVPTYITSSVQRVLDRLTGTPVAVYDASWTLLLTNPPHVALMGDPPARHNNERNGVWRHFLGSGTPARRTPKAMHAYETALVTDLRTAAAQYPADQRLRKLIADLRAESARFAALWDSGAVSRREAARKTIDHPQLGSLTLDCDVLTVAGSDLRIMIYTAEPGTEDAERLATLTVLGTRTLVG
ncbi:helix-turn-helix transcriptional regulator [Nocardia sp. NBC_01009]|uniref:helix-turn-helix transcriptional regulator n=1 Tax=Nocardia sp. NBC_01009 TaxID=2975996 RepID=UPI00386F31D5|nr:helix-turn-helix transcriptional regulator [Nocardia sp. NBC_01009]